MIICDKCKKEIKVCSLLDLWHVPPTYDLCKDCAGKIKSVIDDFLKE